MKARALTRARAPLAAAPGRDTQKPPQKQPPRSPRLNAYRQYGRTSQWTRQAQERDSDPKRRVASVTDAVIPRQPHGLAR
eukprot:2398399-Pleurochrysis_carterae.AAC.1